MYTNGSATNAADLAAMQGIAMSQLEDAGEVVTYREFYDGEQGH